MTAYLDNSATTRPGRSVAELVDELLESGWYNPSALYKPALEIQKRIDAVRENCLRAAGAEGSTIVFTSGGTESDNLALIGHMRTRRVPGDILRGTSGGFRLCGRTAPDGKQSNGNTRAQRRVSGSRKTGRNDEQRDSTDFADAGEQ